MKTHLIRAMTLVAAFAVAAILFSPTSANAEPRKLACSETDASRSCSYMTRNIENNRTIGFRDSVSNARNYPIEGHCEAATSKTSKYSLGSELSAEIKAGIFGGVKVQINSSIEKSMTTGFVTSSTFKIPAKDVVYCDRGIVNERIKGYTKTSWYSGGAGSKTTYWTFQAPSRGRWWIY